MEETCVWPNMPKADLGITRKIGMASNTINRVIILVAWRLFLSEKSIPGSAR